MANLDAIEQEEQHVLAGEAGSGAMTERPQPVAGVGDQRCDDDRDGLGGQRLVVEWSVSARVEQRIEHQQVDDEPHAADGQELQALADELVQPVPEPQRDLDRAGAAAAAAG